MARGGSVEGVRLKYRNKPCELDGEKYRSKLEMNRHWALRMLEKAGHIKELRREVAYELAPSVQIQGRKRPALRYYADFTYIEGTTYVVEDCKGVRTEGYRIKRHLMRSVHGIEILET